ncbi:hypothetical protein FCIRC_12759 [Fusarium circinatum]|uniref:2EXR domain-containing protein n=1 Tax=Fusarium circinatum TaxID=48490 RepID=A0A8H5WG54_FUSCI|nr:hypothetical protein FCIRC_12759 [Fusarium circinatum]
MVDLSIPPRTPRSNEMATFPQFAKLPIELRDMVWEEALKKDRVLSMHVWTLGEDCSDAGRTMELLHGRPLEGELSGLVNSPTTPRLTDGRETEVNPTSKKEYGVMVDDKAAISKLFRVNAESRQAAKRFYRVHIPCTYMKPGFYEKGTLYLRPESDTIRMGLTEGFGRFAYCIWAMDRLHVGLVNLAPDLKVKFSGRNGLAWEYDSFPEDDDTIPGCLDPRWADLRMLPQPLDPISVGPPGFHDRWAKANTPQYLPIEGITLSREVNYGCMLSHGETLHQCLPNRAQKWQCAADLFIQDFRAKGTEVVPGYWLFPMDYLAFVKDDEGDWVVDRNNPNLEEMTSSFEVCIRKLTAYKEQTGIVDCRKRHLWKTS